ncbi:MAG: hypothetical protein L0Z50_30950 [Verrucomicrobiales bacterium]|nr:hypothetical protein [Verrucomicrobiales bacterium]
MPKESASAAEILEKLKGIRVPAGPKRHASLRQVVHQMENLVDLGSAALPVIREFIAKFEDVDYSPEAAPDDDRDELAESSGSPERLPFRDRTQATRPLLPMPKQAPRLEFTTPPSLRLGLVDVLKEIGGEGAEQVLEEMLSGSGRGVEVAYAARALQEIAGPKYRDSALSAAKDLLANSPKIERPTRFDENARAYLYGVLDLYGDTSFAANAQSLLVGADGRIDRTTLNYVTATLKEQAVPVLYQAYKDPRVTNVSERASITAQILSHAGLSEQANDIFREIVSDENVPPWMRSLTIQSLAGNSRGPLASSMPTDSAQLQSRIELLNSLPELGDEQMARARHEAVERLSNRLATVSQSGENPRTFRNRRGQPGNGPASLPGELPPIP